MLRGRIEDKRMAADWITVLDASRAGNGNCADMAQTKAQERKPRRHHRDEKTRAPRITLSKSTTKRGIATKGGRSKSLRVSPINLATSYAIVKKRRYLPVRRVDRAADLGLDASSPPIAGTDRSRESCCSIRAENRKLVGQHIDARATRDYACL